MSQFIGHISAKLDSKGRLTLPASFKKQLAPEAKDTFVVKKDIFENCLVLIPLDEWNLQVEFLRRTLNPFNKEHNMFLRQFFMHTAEVELDAQNRILIPKRLLELVGIERQVELIGAGTKIELWNPQLLEQSQLSDEQFSQLAQQIFKQIDE